MTAAEFKNELKKLSGGYLFCGEEGYLKSHYLTAARKELIQDGDFFNHIVLDSGNYSPDALAEAIVSLPMMADKKLIELTELPLNDMSDEEIEDMCAVLETLPQYEYNVLILYTETDEFDAGTVKQPSALLKTLSKYLKPVMFMRETPSRLAAWTAKHFAAEKIIACPVEVNLLLERCNCDMYILSSEILKLCCYLKANGREKLTEDDIMKVASETKEITAFNFANAILDGKTDSALSVLREMKLRKEKPEIILSGISRVICDLSMVKALAESGATVQTVSKRLKMHEYKAGLYLRSASRCDTEKLRNIMQACADADMRIKASPLDSYEILDRLAAQASKR